MTISQVKKIALLVVLAVVSGQGAEAEPTDYERDTTKVFVQERVSEALEQVNSILCMFDQTKYGDASLVNQGYYTALVDESLCEGRDSAEKSNESSSGGTSASGAKEYNEFKVKSERTDASKPQVVSAFVKIKGPNEIPMAVQAQMVITEPASDFNPVGAFTLSYLGSIAGSPLPALKGIVKSERDSQGRVVIKFAESVGFGGQEMSAIKAALQKNTEGGVGSVYQKESFPGQGPGMGAQSSTASFVYNKSNFKRQDEKGGVCLSRTAFETSAWRYGLYNISNGSRVTVNSGFPINTQADGRGSFGFLSYFGLFLPPGSDALADGANVFRVERGANGPVSTKYTLSVKNGKLKKFTRSDVDLGSLKNVPLEGMIPTMNDQASFSSMKRVQWDGAKLSIVASAQQGQGGPPTWEPVNPPQQIDNTTLLMFGDLGLFSQALGGQVRIKLEGCTFVNQFNPMLGVRCATPTASTKVIFFKESAVQPTDSTTPASLRCYDNCPKAGPAGMDKGALTYPNDGSGHTYTFVGGLLRDEGNAVTLSEAPQGQPWGFNSGPLFEPTTANLNALQCPGVPGQVCSWRAWSELSQFYTWETGPNNWNKFTTVLDGSNDPVTFDPPLPVQFTYPAGTAGLNPSAVDSKYAGNTFFLQYGGFGSLQGIPGKCFNPEDPSDKGLDCSKPGRRWVPEFTIPAGSVAKDANGTDPKYYIKPLEVEQRMSKVADSECASLKIVDLSSSWPSLEKDWQDPALGAEPPLADAPRVIAGVVQ
jgi:hypothetical protein